MDDKTLHDQINAFADGELSADQSVQLLRHLAAHRPELYPRIAEQKQLRLSVRAAMQAPVRTPATLRQAVEQMALDQMPDHPAGPVEAAGSGHAAARSADAGRRTAQLPRWIRWAPLAAAVLIAAVAGLNLYQSQSPADPAINLASLPAETVPSLPQVELPRQLSATTSMSGPQLADHVVGNVPSAGDITLADASLLPGAPDATGLIPDEQRTRLIRRHEQCARLQNQLNNIARFPQQLELVPRAVSEYLGRNPYPGLDFSALGYEFKGIGECRSPGSQSVHLVYRAAPQIDRDSALSLWIQPDDGRLGIPTNQLFSLPDNRNPMLVWRDGGMVYYLMGDSVGAMVGARQVMIASR